MQNDEEQAYPLLECQFHENAEYPALRIITFTTEQGKTNFAVTREILETLAKSFKKEAKKISPGPQK